MTLVTSIDKSGIGESPLPILDFFCMLLAWRRLPLLWARSSVPCRLNMELPEVIPDGSRVFVLVMPLEAVKTLLPLDAVGLLVCCCEFPPLNWSRRFLALDTRRRDIPFVLL